jgi:hypothetical protein
MTAIPSSPSPAHSPLLVVRWRNGDGTQSAGCALPAAHADALCRAFQAFYPRQSFWVEPPPAFASRAGALSARPLHLR